MLAIDEFPRWSQILNGAEMGLVPLWKLKMFFIAVLQYM
jgi:hypothetical protein